MLKRITHEGEQTYANKGSSKIALQGLSVAKMYVIFHLIVHN